MDYTEYEAYDLWNVKIPEDMPFQEMVALIAALQKELKYQFEDARDWSSHCKKLYDELKAAKSEAEGRAAVHE